MSLLNSENIVIKCSIKSNQPLPSSVLSQILDFALPLLLPLFPIPSLVIDSCPLTAFTRVPYPKFRHTSPHHQTTWTCFSSGHYQIASMPILFLNSTLFFFSLKEVLHNHPAISLSSSALIHVPSSLAMSHTHTSCNFRHSSQRLTYQFGLGKRHWNLETSSGVVEFQPPYHPCFIKLIYSCKITQCPQKKHHFFVVVLLDPTPAFDPFIFKNKITTNFRAKAAICSKTPLEF